MSGWVRALVTSLAISLAACGGGGGGSNPGPNPAPASSGISYAAQPAFTIDSPIATVTPAKTGSVSTFTVSPALPAGLAISSTTGAISGTPTTITPAATYTVSAVGSAGNVSTTISLMVNDHAPGLSFSKSWWSFSKGQPISTIVPDLTGGAVQTWSIDRALPAGLTFNSANGRISGTATVISPETDYLISAGNSGGTSSAILTLRIDDLVPDIAYPKSDYALGKGEPVSIVPANYYGTVVTWSVNPALPAGLNFNTTNGLISGTPTATTPATAYTITGTNTGGIAYFHLSIAVEDSALLDLGHADTVQAIRRDAQRMISMDANGHAVLWNAQTGTILATHDDVQANTGTISCSSNCDRLIGLGGNTAAVQSVEWLILLDSTSGTQLAHVHAPGNIRWWQVARDGSYVVAATNTTLTAWSRTGDVLFTRSSNYGSAKAFAASGELRIGGGPAGANLIETITVPGGVSASSAVHQGTFHSWFEDGGKFLSNVGNTVWVYSKEAAQLDFVTLPQIDRLTGQGNWFWTYKYPPAQIDVYAVGSSSAPAATYALSGNPTIVASGGTIGVLPYGTNTMSVVDLSGGTPVKNDYTGPTHYFGAYGAASKEDWAVGAMFGVLLGELTASPQLYSYGQALSIAGNANDIVVATASGHMLDFDAHTRALKRDIEYGASKVELSADGSRVVAAPLLSSTMYAPVKNLRVYSLSSGAVLNEWTYPSGGHLLVDFDVAEAADALGQVVDTDVDTTPERIVTTLAGTPIWSSSAIAGANSMFLSPDGTQSAITGNGPATTAGINIYANGALTGAVSGVVAGWLDNMRLVVNRYVNDNGVPGFDHLEVTSTTGIVQISSAAGSASSIQPVNANTFYIRNSSKLVDATNGTVLYSSADPRGKGAVAGSSVVFATGAVVRIEPL